MIIIGLIILVVGLLLGHRLIAYVGAALLVAGLILLLVATPGPIGGYYW